MSSWEVQRGVWVHAQSGALERCVKVERPKAMGAKVAAGLWNASSERISLGLHISLPAWSAGLRWQPSNLICQKDRLLAAVLTLRPAAQSNLWKSQFPPPEEKPTGSFCKAGKSHFLCNPHALAWYRGCFMWVVAKWIHGHSRSPRIWQAFVTDTQAFCDTFHCTALHT